MSFKFERLDVWQKSLDMSFYIHDLAKSFPKEEIYILTSQMKRAADSVALNIAEGSTGQSNSEFKQFLGYAIRSAIEVVACLHIGKRRNIIETNKFHELYNRAEVVVKVLQALRKKMI